MRHEEWFEWLKFQNDQDWDRFTEDQQKDLVAYSQQNAGDVEPEKQLSCMKETLRQYLDGELDLPWTG